MPGPGDYRSPEPKMRQAAIIRPSTAAQKPKDGPGPGQYSQDDTATKKGQASVRMGAAKRADHLPGVADDAGESPGPGAFY